MIFRSEFQKKQKKNNRHDLSKSEIRVVGENVPTERRRSAKLEVIFS